ncbi:MAG TPA: response regulator [Pyrinomonadaceae bacterium]
MSKRKLLLADDSITIQKVVNLTFADEGIEVISVGDGDAAMQKIAEDAPNLVLADVNMPGMSGYQICESIKQNAATQTIPVILLVGSFEPFDEAEAYRVGADDYLTKPFQSIRQLVSKVSDLLESANGAQAAVAGTAESNAAAGANVGRSGATDFYTVDSYSVDNDYANESASNPLRIDDGIDDEMIQTDQIGSLPADETQKFMTGSQTERRTENFTNQPVYTDFEPQLNLPEETSMAENSSKLKRSSDEIFQLFSEESNTETNEASVFEFTSEPTGNRAFSADETLEIGDVSDSGSARSSAQISPIDDNEILLDEIPSAAPVSAASFDDMDLLELPSVKPKTSSKKGADVGTRTGKDAEPSTVNANEKSGKSKDRVNQFSRLSPEAIEALAQKVAEKISDRAIREIAAELVPQLTASIIKKMEQERQKE